MRWRVALWVATLAAAASAPSAGGRTPGGCRGHRGVGPAPARPGRLRWRLALDPPCTHGHLRLRGGGESASGRLGRWHSKFPLGMALYEVPSVTPACWSSSHGAHRAERVCVRSALLA